MILNIKISYKNFITKIIKSFKELTTCEFTLSTRPGYSIIPCNFNKSFPVFLIYRTFIDINNMFCVTNNSCAMRAK